MEYGSHHDITGLSLRQKWRDYLRKNRTDARVRLKKINVKYCKTILPSRNTIPVTGDAGKYSYSILGMVKVRGS